MAEQTDKEQNTTKIITSSGTIRIETPAGKNRQKKPRVSVIGATDEVMDGFVTFLRTHAVVALAIGFVIATQVQTLAKELIESFLDPLFSLLFGHALSDRTFTLHFHGRTADFGWGSFVYGLLDFLFVLGTLYLLIKILKLDKLDTPKAPKPAEGKSEPK